MSEQARFCGNCGAALAPEARFCGECGTSVPDSGSTRATEKVAQQPKIRRIDVGVSPASVQGAGDTQGEGVGKAVKSGTQTSPLDVVDPATASTHAAGLSAGALLHIPLMAASWGLGWLLGGGVGLAVMRFLQLDFYFSHSLLLTDLHIIWGNAGARQNFDEVGQIGWRLSA